MTHDEFGIEYMNYYSRVNDRISGAVAKSLRNVPEQYLGRIYEELLNHVPANRTPGVAEIREVCERIGAPTAYASTYREQKTYHVTCDCCGYEYRWSQGAKPEQAQDHIFDFCIRCRFPFSETVTMMGYEQVDRAAVWKPAYERIKAYYHKEWQAREKRARSA